MSDYAVDVGDGTWTWSRNGIRVEAQTPKFSKGQVRAVLSVFKDGTLAHRDRFLLTSARERTKYLERVAEAGVEVPPPAVLLIEEAIRDTPPEDEEPGPESGEGIPPEVERGAKALLADPELLDRALQVIKDRGLVGEETNAPIVLLSGVGGVLDSAIHLVIHGDSSGGKNNLVRRALELLPPRYVLAVSGLSEHALEYRGGRIEGALVVDEAEGQGQAEYGLRVAMSEGRITRLTVNKGESGENEAQELEVEVAASVITTTTAPALHAENQTRVFDLFVDERKELTDKVLQRRAQEAAGTAPEVDAVELKTWRAAIEMLEPAEVVIPWAETLVEDFPTDTVRARRDFPRVLALVEASALLHQKQRPRDEGGRIVATRADWKIVRPLVQAVLGPSMSGINDTAKQLAALHDELVEDSRTGWLRRPDLESEAAARSIASRNTVHKWCKRLAELGIWEGRRKNGGAWEHRRLRDVVEEPIPLPQPEDLPESPENGSGRRSSHNYAHPEGGPNPPNSGGGRRSSRNDGENSTPPNESARSTGHPPEHRIEERPDPDDYAEFERWAIQNENAPTRGEAS